jgi:hypothetical protein
MRRPIRTTRARSVREGRRPGARSGRRVRRCGLCDRSRRDDSHSLLARERNGIVDQPVDHTRRAAGQSRNPRDSGRFERRRRLRDRDGHPVSDVVGGLIFPERLQPSPPDGAVVQLAQRGSVDQPAQRRRPDEDDLQQRLSTVRPDQLAQPADRFHRHLVRIVNDEHGGSVCRGERGEEIVYPGDELASPGTQQ